jgi:hypothetical protein
MVLDDKDAAVAQRIGFDAVFDVFAKPLAAVEVGAPALGGCAAEKSEFHGVSRMCIGAP